MKQMRRTLQIAITVVGLAAASMALSGPAAFAQDEAAFVGVLDRDFVYKNSKAGANLLANLQAALKKLDDEALATGKEFRAEEKKINDDCKTVGEADCKAKIQAFGDKVRAAEADQTKRRKALEKRRDDGRDKITKALEPIVTKIIKERKLLLVIDRAALIHAAESLDVTEEALKALDVSLPKIN